MLGGSNGLFGGSNTGCNPSCTDQYSSQISNVYGQQSFVQPKIVSGSSCGQTTYAQPTSCYPVQASNSQHEYIPSGTSYNVANTFSAPSYEGNGFHGQSFVGQSGGFNPVLSAAALGGVPALRGQYRSRNTASHFYGNAGLNWYDVDTDALGLQLRGGYQANRHLGAEVEGSLGINGCLLYTSPSPRDQRGSRMPSSA